MLLIPKNKEVLKSFFYYPKFYVYKEGIQEGCLKSSSVFKVVHSTFPFLYVSLLLFYVVKLRLVKIFDFKRKEKRSMRTRLCIARIPSWFYVVKLRITASHRHYEQLAFKIFDFNKQGWYPFFG